MRCLGQERELPGLEKGPRRWQKLDLLAEQGLVCSQCQGPGLEEERGGVWARGVAYVWGRSPVSEARQRERVWAGSGVRAIAS